MEKLHNYLVLSIIQSIHSINPIESEFDGNFVRMPHNANATRMKTNEIEPASKRTKRSLNSQNAI